MENKFWNRIELMFKVFFSMLKSGLFFVISARPNFIIFQNIKRKFFNFSPHINVEQAGLLIKLGLDT